jgi:hypothetical protein
MTKKVTNKLIGADDLGKSDVKEGALKKKIVVKHISVPKEIKKADDDVGFVPNVVKKPKAKKMTAKEREELLIENFVGLQHAMTNMSVKFGALSDNMTKLLQVFEEAARSFVSGDKTDDKDMLKKIDSLLDQNKTIAKGLVLMEGKLRGRAEPGVVSNRPRVAEGQVPPRSEPLRAKPRPLPSI